MISKKITEKFRIKWKIYQAPKNTCDGKSLHNPLKKEKRKNKAKFTHNILKYTLIKN